MPTSKPETKLLNPLSYPDCEEGWEEAGYRPPRQVWQSGFTAKAAIPERNPAETLIRPQDCRKLYRWSASASPNEDIFVRMVFDSPK
jgi:hypothetical protein